MPQRRLSTQLDYVPLAQKIKERVQSNESPFFSVEFFPPNTHEAAYNLVMRFDHFRQMGPLFADVTWHAKGDPEGDSPTSSITVAGMALNFGCLNVMLHIICVGMTEKRLRVCLERAKALGIRNILALRGDKLTTNMESDFTYATDLILYIRKHYGDYFTIACAGYPTTHPESPDKASDLKYLKAKVDAGADFIITQLFFDADVFIKFVEDCRGVGIDVPILPGILPIQNYLALEKISKLSKMSLPTKLLESLEPIKNNDEAVRKFGIDWAIDTCRKILKRNIVPGLHFYTLNQEYATTEIVKALGLVCPNNLKPLPWVLPVNHKRCNENVRPIFWSTRPKSYVFRTNTWDDFPNGRWGNIDSPAFGNLNDYYFFFEPLRDFDQLRKMWGKELKSEQDVWEVFYCYLSGDTNRQGHKVEYLPWNDESLKPETSVIIDKLAHFNKHGILTINSQPNVNGAPSSDPVFGWGYANGYVYQKVNKDRDRRCSIRV